MSRATSSASHGSARVDIWEGKTERPETPLPAAPDLQLVLGGAVESSPQLKRGQVWCTVCVATQMDDSAERLRNGWPKCCGYTMTIDHPMERLLRAEGYTHIRQLPDGRWCAVRDMVYTAALCVDLDAVCYYTRYCYERRADAEAALGEWDGTGDPPGPWIKQKPQERLNPAWARGEV